MKLTVGPLPAGVYWRRRAIVGGVVLVVAILLWTSCGGGGAEKASSAASGASTTAAAEPTVTIQVPTTGEAPPSFSSEPALTPSSAAPRTSGTEPQCADADLSVMAAPEQATQLRGAYMKFTLKIKNVSTHDCVRDIGADFQELYLKSDTVTIWSSDACNAPKGSELSVLKPSIEVSFVNNWNGKATNNGCANRVAPPTGKYELFGRLGTKISEPVQVQLT